ncbi:MAG: UDP-N-acetylmuramate dehydrogenase [Anaerolineaceae bacterium]|nr:UDP-N-acetylmuramate dehydrogenase [Anaerolineaceae bacterium]
MSSIDERALMNHFGSRLQKDVPLANLTTAKVGGAARFFVVANSADELALDVSFLWSANTPFLVLGTGANLLISDAGLDMVVVHNKAKAITIDATPSLFAESGAILATVARQAGLNGLTGLEWASTIPGTLGGAIYGNAGAHGGDMSKSLVLANILHRKKGHLSLTSEQMGYAYRSSALKRDPGNAVILSAQLAVQKGHVAAIKAQMEENAARRKNTQPPGASMGSTFKNPVGDHAGRLIESVGLKGFTIGGVQVSPVHANFLVNNGSATAEDYRRLILLIQKTVQERTGIKLELEIELLGNWQD